MILFPAIDLKDGECVRLVKGDFNQSTTYNKNPVEQALAFQNLGFSWLHIVDLDGAVAGQPIHKKVIQDIRSQTSLNIQIGGGIRSLDTIEAWLSEGVNRVILGTAALKNPDLVKQACKEFPDRIAVGIDARDGYVATEGWAEKSEITTIELAQKFEDAGVRAIIFTDISRDGALVGPNIQATIDLANKTSIPVIASGGVSNINDLIELKKHMHVGIEGVISGKAIYENTLDPKQALEILASGDKQYA